MAGGVQYKAEFLRHLLTKGPYSKEYKDAMPELKGIERAKLLDKAKDALSFRLQWGQNQTEVDREAIKAVYQILLGVKIPLGEITAAGIKDYGYNSPQTIKKLRDGVPRADPGRKQEWT